MRFCRLFGAPLEGYLRAKRHGESVRDDKETQRGKKEDPQMWKDPLGAAARHSVLQCRQGEVPHESHRGATPGSTTETFISAQSWSDSLLLLLLALAMRLLSAPHVPNVRPNMIKRGTLVLQRVTMLLVLLLLCTLPQTVMGACHSNEARTAPGNSVEGCPQGYYCADAGSSGSCRPCVAGKWNGHTFSKSAITSCTSCVAGKYSAATGYSAGPTAAVCNGLCTAGKYS